MQVKALGAKRVSGISKAEKPFDIPSLLIMTKIETTDNGRIKVEGGGYEIAEMPVLPEAFDQFKGLSYPCDLKLNTETIARYGKFESVCSGFVAPAAKAANG